MNILLQNPSQQECFGDENVLRTVDKLYKNIKLLEEQYSYCEVELNSITTKFELTLGENEVLKKENDLFKKKNNALITEKQILGNLVEKNKKTIQELENGIIAKEEKIKGLLSLPVIDRNISGDFCSGISCPSNSKNGNMSTSAISTSFNSTSINSKKIGFNTLLSLGAVKKEITQHLYLQKQKINAKSYINSSDMMGKKREMGNIEVGEGEGKGEEEEEDDDDDDDDDDDNYHSVLNALYAEID